MTEDSFKRKIEHMLDGHGDQGGIREVILNAAMGVVASEYSHTRYLENADDNFILPKQVLTAVLQQLAWQYEPNDKKGKSLVKEMKVFVRFN